MSLCFADQRFIWKFVLAKVATPLLGADFGFSLDVGNRHLINAEKCGSLACERSDVTTRKLPIAISSADVFSTRLLEFYDVTSNPNPNPAWSIISPHWALLSTPGHAAFIPINSQSPKMSLRPSRSSASFGVPTVHGLRLNLVQDLELTRACWTKSSLFCQCLPNPMVSLKHVSLLICEHRCMCLFVMMPSEAHYDLLKMDHTAFEAREQGFCY